MSTFDESKHPRDDKGRFVDVYKMSAQEVIALGKSLGVEWSKSNNMIEYRAKVKLALQREQSRDKINLSKQEWAQYYEIIGKAKHGEFVYHASETERWIRLDHKIVIDNNEFGTTTILRVLVFPDNDSMNDLLNLLSEGGIIK